MTIKKKSDDRKTKLRIERIEGRIAPGAMMDANVMAAIETEPTSSPHFDLKETSSADESVTDFTLNRNQLERVLHVDEREVKQRVRGQVESSTGQSDRENENSEVQIQLRDALIDTQLVGNKVAKLNLARSLRPAPNRFGATGGLSGNSARNGMVDFAAADVVVRTSGSGVGGDSGAAMPMDIPDATGMTAHGDMPAEMADGGSGAGSGSGSGGGAACDSVTTGKPIVAMTTQDSIAPEEGSDIAVITVHRNDGGNNNLPLVVALRTSGTATAGVDYQIPNSVTIPACEGSLRLEIPTVNDTKIETLEWYMVEIAPSGNYSITTDHRYEGSNEISIPDNEWRWIKPNGAGANGTTTAMFDTPRNPGDLEGFGVVRAHPNAVESVLQATKFNTPFFQNVTKTKAFDQYVVKFECDPVSGAISRAGNMGGSGGSHHTNGNVSARISHTYEISAPPGTTKHSVTVDLTGEIGYKSTAKATVNIPVPKVGTIYSWTSGESSQVKEVFNDVVVVLHCVKGDPPQAAPLYNSTPPAKAGDGNRDGSVNQLDIDGAFNLRNSGSYDPAFDFDLNGAITDSDIDVLVEAVLHSEYGDADLNGTAEFADFLVVSQNLGKAGGWADGDFDGDGQVSFADFLILNGNFG